MRIIIETNETGKAKITDSTQTNVLEGVSVPVIDSGTGPEGQTQVGNIETNFNSNNQTFTNSDTIDAGEVPSELLELMAKVESTQTDNSEGVSVSVIDSGTGPEGQT